jgi:hypothetical protein
MGYWWIVVIVVVALFLLWRIRMSHPGKIDTGELQMTTSVPTDALLCKLIEMDLSRGGSIRAYQLSASGRVAGVPAGRECIAILTVTDVTERHVGFPVFCMLETMADDEGHFLSSATLQVPYADSAFRNLLFAPVPLDALVLPKRGARELQFEVHVVDPQTSYKCFRAYARVTLYETRYGYFELENVDIETDAAVAGLGLAIGAGDGNLDKRELAVIHRFLDEQIQAVHPEAREVRKQALNDELKALLDNAKAVLLQAPRSVIEAEIRRQCERIQAVGSPELNVKSYTLCVEIVAADEQVNKQELAMLKVAAAGLGINDEQDREIHEHYLRLSMYDKQNLHEAFQYPPGLSTDEKRKYLNERFNVWAGRVTHSDPQIRAEAERWKQVIAAERIELERGLPEQPVAVRPIATARTELDRHEAFQYPPGLSKDEKRKCLNEKYNVWLGRVTHSDPQIRAEAERWMEAIATARKELDRE